jgi:hypothetical protein
MVVCFNAYSYFPITNGIEFGRRVVQSAYRGGAVMEKDIVIFTTARKPCFIAGSP